MGIRLPRRYRREELQNNEKPTGWEIAVLLRAQAAGTQAADRVLRISEEQRAVLK